MGRNLQTALNNEEAKNQIMKKFPELWRFLKSVDYLGFLEQCGFSKLCGFSESGGFPEFWGQI
jgi:hypothetical protein